MELHLGPAFYMKVETTSPQTMVVLPSVKKGPQKVAVGDESGVVTCFKVKRRDTTIVFKTLPDRPKISRLKLGGPEGSPADRIYVSSEMEVRGFSNKGKNFLSFETNLTEPIHSMCVQNSHLLVCDSCVYNHYVDCKDTHYYLSSDRINDVICLPATPTREFSPILACQDRYLRLLKGSELLYEVEVAGSPLCVALNGEGAGEEGEEVLYGTESGRLGLVQLQSSEPSHRWDMLNERKYGGISCLSTFDLTGDGVPEIVVGRDDGVVEVYSVDESSQPCLKFTQVFNESVTSVGGGVISSPQYEEVVVCTYSGRITGLTREPLASPAISQEMQAKLEALRQEVEGIETKVDLARDHYHHTVLSPECGLTVDAVSASPVFPVNDRFVLNHDEAWYTLTIELQAPIEMIVLQSNVPLDLQEVDKGSAVVSHSPPDIENDNFVLVTFRCHNTTRLEVKVRSIEGHQGQLLAYITPALEPKICQVRHYPIKPLSLHQRVHSFDETRPVNTLQLAGHFSLAEAHSCVSLCLPGIPEQLPAEDHSVLHFRSAFIDSQLECSYRKGELVFRSDNMSTISVLKEVLSKEAAKRKISVKITHVLDESSVEHMLGLIYPQLEAQLMLAKNVQLIEGLQEIQIHEQDTSCLSPQCQFILENASAMQEELRQQPAMIERLYALVTDLYIDRAGFKGQNVRGKVPQLMELLDNCDLQTLIQFFNSEK